jgi:hypothetical protein
LHESRIGFEVGCRLHEIIEAQWAGYESGLNHLFVELPG